MSSNPKIILISGASGFIGAALKADFSEKGWVVRELSRKPSSSPNSFLWDPARGTIDPSALQGADVVVHLAGESIASLPWTEKKRKKIKASRVAGTSLIADAAARADKKPRLFISASAVGLYGNRGEEVLTEDSPAGQGFLADVAKDWESAAKPASDAGIRVAHLRIGIVLGKNGGIIKSMLRPFKLGLGGTLGSGRQFMSWISLKDIVRAFGFIIDSPSLSGAFNLTAPSPCTNLEFTRALGRALHRPTIFPVPAFILRIILGDFADEVLLGSTRAVPKRLMESGFSFEHKDLDSALSWALSS